MKQPAPYRVLLAVDPFEQDLPLSITAINELHYLVQHLGASFEAVHILSDSRSDQKIDLAYRRTQEALKNSSWVKHLGIHIPCTVIVDQSTLRNHASAALLEYAEEIRANLILVCSHGRKWLSRLVMGSFAETLLSLSPLPILFFSPNPPKNPKFDRVLFATDFSENSKKGFELFLKQMAPLNPEVILYHAVPSPELINNYSLMGLGAYIPNQYWKAEKEILIEAGREWADLARPQKIEVKVVIEDFVDHIAHTIQKTADHHQVSIIGMVTSTPPLERAFAGSIAAGVYRSRKQSVWVYRSR